MRRVNSGNWGLLSFNLGRGRQVIAVAKTADLILMILDSVKGEEQVVFNFL